MGEAVGGHGLIGMHERVELFGGTVHGGSGARRRVRCAHPDSPYRMPRRDTVRIPARADDVRLVRTGFRMILASEPDIEVVGEAADGVEAVQLARG